MNKTSALLGLCLMTLSLSACAKGPPSTAAAAFASTDPAAAPKERNAPLRAACGSVVVWDDAFQALVLSEYVQLPPGSPWRKVLKDAIDARDAVKICRGEFPETL